MLTVVGPDGGKNIGLDGDVSLNLVTYVLYRHVYGLRNSLSLVSFQQRPTKVW